MSPEEKDLEVKKAAFGVYRRLESILEGLYNVTVEPQEWDETIVSALTRHDGHLSLHRIHQKSLDPLKFSCWLCGALLDRRKKVSDGQVEGRKIISATIHYLLKDLLLLETKRKADIPRETCDLIEKLVFEEYFGSPEHGVGMNGLFLSFHCARSSMLNFLELELGVS